MKQRYLEVTYRNGKMLAAYLYLPRNPDDKAARSERREGGLVIDYASDGRAIGIEFTSPSHISLDALNGVLSVVNQAPITSAELAPLTAA